MRQRRTFRAPLKNEAGEAVGSCGTEPSARSRPANIHRALCVRRGAGTDAVAPPLTHSRSSEPDTLPLIGRAAACGPPQLPGPRPPVPELCTLVAGPIAPHRAPRARRCGTTPGRKFPVRARWRAEGFAGVHNSGTERFSGVLDATGVHNSGTSPGNGPCASRSGAPAPPGTPAQHPGGSRAGRHRQGPRSRLSPALCDHASKGEPERLLT